MNLPHKISVVVPVFNEQESILETIDRLISLRKQHLSIVSFEFILVDDGSVDRSLELMKQAAGLHPFIRVLSLSRNFGHQIAITAGIDHADGDYVAVIDADLQDPPELIFDMYQLALTGFDVVYGKRRTRAGETWFKKGTASAFYRLIRYMCEIDIDEKHSCASHVYLQTGRRSRFMWRSLAAVFSLVFHGAKGDFTPLACGSGGQ